MWALFSISFFSFFLPFVQTNAPCRAIIYGVWEIIPDKVLRADWGFTCDVGQNVNWYSSNYTGDYIYIILNNVNHANVTLWNGPTTYTVIAGPNSAINKELLIINFGSTQQTVEDSWYQAFSQIAEPRGTVELQGKYRVVPQNLRKVTAKYFSGPPVVHSILYTDKNGVAFVGFGMYTVSATLGYYSELYFYNKVWDTKCDPINGFSVKAIGCEELDFGDVPQEIDTVFYYEVLRHVLVPIVSEQYMDTAGAIHMKHGLLNNSDAQVEEAISSIKAPMAPVLAYNSSSTTRILSTTSHMNYDALIIIATPRSNANQVVTYVPLSSLKNQTSSSLLASVSNNSYTTTITITSSSIAVTSTYSGAASPSAQSTTYRGYLKGIYGLKMGG